MTGLRWLISLGLAMARLAPMALRGMANCAAVGPASTLNDANTSLRSGKCRFHPTALEIAVAESRRNR